MPSSNRPVAPGSPSLGRKLAFRLGAVLLGLLPLVAVEAALGILDWGRPDVHDDPFVGFKAVHPLFVLGEDGSRYEVSPSRLDYFRPESFAAEKQAGEFRIFCLGGSTVQGRPFAVETSFTTWLEISLQAADPSRTWEVVNCGGVSYASYRLVPILEEVLGYQPNLVILYTGHNEFLEDRTYRHLKRLPAPLAWPCRQLARTRTFVLLNRAYRQVRGESADTAPENRPMLESEVAAMLESPGGLGLYHRDERWRQDTIEHFRHNVARMVQTCRQSGVPVVLVNPVASLRDCPPFKSEHRAGLEPDELARWQTLLDAAAEYGLNEQERALALLQEAAEIDDQHAGAYYTLAQCYDDLGMFEEAHAAYLQAKELDVCPLRIVEPMNEAILDVAEEAGAILVDVRKFYEEASDAGIPGGYLLVDHVHPSITGHQKIADLLAEELVARGFIQPVPQWHETRDRRYGEHLQSLDDFYFSKGQQRLEALRRWAQGAAGRRQP